MKTPDPARRAGLFRIISIPTGAILLPLQKNELLSIGCPRFARRASLRTYLYGAARNLALKRLRRLKSERAENPGDTESTSAAEAPLRGLLARELSAKVRAAIAGMPSAQREVILLFEYEGQSLIEIAAIIGSDVGTVKWRLHQARGWLRKELAPYLNGGAGGRRENENHEG